MIYSRSSQYAIRALTHLAREQDRPLCQLETIARTEGIPHHFLGKIMQRLVRKRLVRSVKGINGGFVLALSPHKINLFRVVDAIDDISLAWDDCIFDHQTCSDQTSCPLHFPWKEIKQRELEFLQNITIGQLATANDTNVSSPSVPGKDKRRKRRT